jgi:hypothetical protein
MENINEDELELRRIRFRDDEGNLIGCFTTVSIVDEPAIELEYQLFNKQEVNTHKFEIVSDEKMEICGPVLVPDMPILRIDQKTDKPYNVIFTKEDIIDARDIYFRTANHNQVNFQHKSDNYTNKIGLVEAWTVIDKAKDKANALKFDMSKIPLGTLFMTYKVLDRGLWEDLKGSNFKGFSVEIGAYEQKIENKNFSDEIESLLNEMPQINVKSKYTLLYSLIKDIVFADGMDEETKYKLVRKLLTKI